MGPAAQAERGSGSGAAPDRHLTLVWSAGHPPGPGPGGGCGTPGTGHPPAAPGAVGRTRRRSSGVVRGGLAQGAVLVARADRRVLRALRRRGEDRRVAGAVRVLGLTGEHAGVWIAAGAAGALGDPERRGDWLRATAAVAAAHAAAMGGKRAVRRPRPRTAGAAPLVRTAADHSFPSAHAASSAAAAVAFGALLPGAAAVPALAAAICLSRLVAGVHYPSDVACGALLGAAAARLGRSRAVGGGVHG